MIPFYQTVEIQTLSVPRVGGGDPELVGELMEVIKCSPRRRG